MTALDSAIAEAQAAYDAAAALRGDVRDPALERRIEALVDELYDLREQWEREHAAAREVGR